MLTNKSMKEKARGLRQHLGCKNGDFAGVSLSGSRRGEKRLQAAIPPMDYKSQAADSREKKVLAASRPSAQPEAAVYLAPVTFSIPDRAPGGSACSGAAGWATGPGRCLA